MSLTGSGLNSMRSIPTFGTVGAMAEIIDNSIQWRVKGKVANINVILLEKGKNPGQCKVLVMGITFKEDVSDIRNSKVVDLIKELMSYSMNVHITDPHASPNEIAHEYQLTMTEQLADNYDAVILAVAHEEFKAMTIEDIIAKMNGTPILFDLKGIHSPTDQLEYWRL